MTSPGFDTLASWRISFLATFFSKTISCPFARYRYWKLFHENDISSFRPISFLETFPRKRYLVLPPDIVFCNFLPKTISCPSARYRYWKLFLENDISSFRPISFLETFPRKRYLVHPTDIVLEDFLPKTISYRPKHTPNNSQAPENFRQQVVNDIVKDRTVFRIKTRRYFYGFS